MALHPFALMLGLALVLPAAPSSKSSDLAHLIPKGKVVVDQMALVPSERGQELTRRLQASVSAHPDWWREHLKQAAPGKALPYDKRLGVTEAEYQELLTLSRQVALSKKSESSVTFTWTSPTRVEIAAPKELEALNGAVIDLAADTITTSYGTLRERHAINNSAANSPTGPWQGQQWSAEELSSDSSAGHVVKLGFGVLAQSQRGIVYFDAKQMQNGVVVRKANHILFLDRAPVQ
jgi:hypothetical protein